MYISKCIWLNVYCKNYIAKCILQNWYYKMYIAKCKMYIFSLDLHLQEERGRKKDGEEKTDNGEKGRLVVKIYLLKCILYHICYIINIWYMEECLVYVLYISYSFDVSICLTYKRGGLLSKLKRFILNIVLFEFIFVLGKG